MTGPMTVSKAKPLWKAEDQRARLAELTARSDEPAKDNPLRRDVRSLGAILGNVLVEQSGQELFESVEELRRILIEHRETARRENLRHGTLEHGPGQASAPALMLRAQEIVSRMDLSRAYQVTKAFAAYFELTNLAETNHRKRRRRAGQLDSEHPPLPGSFRGTLLRMNSRRRKPRQHWARSRLFQYSRPILPKSRARPSCSNADVLRNNWNASTDYRLRRKRRKTARTTFVRKSPHCGRPTKFAWRSPQ